MSANPIRYALGLLQDDSENEQAWKDLDDALALAREEGGAAAEGAAGLLAAARRAHEMRREHDAVARLLEREARLLEGTPEEPRLLAELAQLLDEDLLDDDRATAIYRRILELVPGDPGSEEAIERSEGKRARWPDVVERFLSEAKKTNESAFKSSLLVSAAETAYRYGRSGADETAKAALLDTILGRLRDALEIDPRNRRAAHLVELVFRDEGRWEELAAALERGGQAATGRDEKIAYYLRLARLRRKRLGDRDRAMEAYERVAEIAPGQPEATSSLVDYFTEKEAWDRLVLLYEQQLKAGAVASGEENAVLLQIAMVNWKKRLMPTASEPYFERLRRSEPAHPTMLTFFREWCAAQGDATRLSVILTDAVRVMPDGPQKTAIASEVAKLAEEGANATKAIEQWRALLRQEPTNREARDALKRLYRQTGNAPALADLLRQDLERIPQEEAGARLPVLREIALLYRESIRNDAALASVLSQIVALDSADTWALRDLARVYEGLGRWRDLLTVQSKLAELETDPIARAELYRAVARRWLEQFNNVQNAAEAYEKLREAVPDDREAFDKLRELYTKRRAYRPLFELYEREVEHSTDRRLRLELLLEMAKLAAERLDRGADATRLFKRLLDEDPTNTAALDALEKQAERDKDFVTVADVLERRVELAHDDATRLAALQKLGVLYADRLQDPSGATRAWKRVLDLQPGNAKAIRVLRDSYLALGDLDGLAALYGRENDWEGLAEVLSGAVDRVQDPDLKVEMAFRAADVYVERLKVPARAYRAYERVLSVRPQDPRAAAALVPLYEADEKWAKLPPLYEVLLEQAETTADKLEILRKLEDVSRRRLMDKAEAFRHARRAYQLAPEREGAVEMLESAARGADMFEDLAAVLETRLASDDAGLAEKRELRERLAALYASDLGRLDDAIGVYRSLAEEKDVEEQLLLTVDRVFRGAERRDDLRWLFELRLGRVRDDEARVDLLAEWAALEEEVFGEPDQAIVLYRRLLDVAPRHGSALRALGRLLKAKGDAQGAVEVLERDRDERVGDERAAREVEIARLYAGPLRRPSLALEAAQRALALVRHEPQALEVIEGLLVEPATRAAAAETLDDEYARAGNVNRQAEILEVRIAEARAEGKLDLYRKLADVHEHKRHDGDAAFGVVARAAKDFPTELPLWDRLAALATGSRRAQAHAETLAAVLPPTGETTLPEEIEVDLAERAATLYEEKLGDIDQATPYLERVLARRPTDERAFARLKQIHTTRERWSDLEELYERVVTATLEPSKKADLLAEVALVAEEITADRPKAIRYYERILELEPTFEHAVRALDNLYSLEERWSALAKLLETRLEGASGGDVLVLRQRLGALYATRLTDPVSALPHLEAVLEADPAARESRELVEAMLNDERLREPAARALEGAYVALDDAGNLVRILDARLGLAAGLDGKKELLRRIAQLRDERLRDGAGAFDALARLLPLEPEDVSVRARLLELAEATGRDQDASAVLAEAAQNATAPQPRADLLTEQAKLLEERIGDRAKAEATYRAVFDLAPDDATIALPAAKALDRLLSADGDPSRLREILYAEVRLEEEPAEKRALYGRIGEISEDRLEDLPAAIAAYKHRLELDAADEQALVALDRLYERTGAYRELVEVLRAREPLVAEGELRKELATRAASTLADRLDDVPAAIVAYRGLLDDFGQAKAPLEALERLYEKAEDWPALGETLEARLALAEANADGNGERLTLLARLGDVRTRKLSDLPGALEAYRQALTLDPTHLPSRAALEAFLDVEAAQNEAALLLRPLYETEGAHERLLRVLVILHDHEAATPARLALLGEAADVAEGPLLDPGRAFGYVVRGLEEAVAEPDLAAWMSRAEKLASTAGKSTELLELLRRVAPEVTDDDLQLEALRRVGELARDHLGDRPLARTYFGQALEHRSDDERSLLALDALYEQDQMHPELLGILRRRTELAANDDDRKALLYRQARLLDGPLADAPAAIEVYGDILDLAMEAEAIAALERLYMAREQWEDLLALYEREIGTEGTDAERRATLHYKRGKVLEVRLGDVSRAFDEYEEALEAAPGHASTVEALEGLMAVREHGARAAAMLEGVYLARLDWRKVILTLEKRLETADDPEVRAELLRRLAKLHEEQGEDYAAALATMARLLAEDVRHEATWEELERLAKVAQAPARLASIFATELGKVEPDDEPTARLAYRTGELFEGERQTDEALRFYRRAYGHAPADSPEAFQAIDRLLTQASRPSERVALYRGALDYRVDAEDRLQTLATVATIEENDLGDVPQAISTWREALDVDEGDARPVENLARLYAKSERWGDLADHTRRRAEQAALPEEEAKLRLELGELLQDRLGRTADAIEEYEAVVGLVDPVGSDVGRRAVTRLEALIPEREWKGRVVELLRPIYEKADDWRALVRLNDERLGLAAEVSEKVAFYRETARFWEERGQDKTRAFEATRDAFVLDPDDGATREELERLAEEIGAWDALADAYEAGLPRASELTKRELLLALAQLHDKRRDDPRKALDAYLRLTQLDETDLEPYDAMVTLATLLSDWPTLVRVLAKRAELVADDEARASTWRRIGEARRDMLEDAAGAIQAYERALELEPTSAFTVDNLIDLYEQKNDAARLVDLYRRRVELCEEGDEELKFRLLVDAAERYEKGLGDRREAIAQLAEALTVKPDEPSVVQKLDGLYTSEKMWPELLDNLRQQAAAVAEDSTVRRTLQKRIASLLAGELDDPAQALEAYRGVLAQELDLDAITAVRHIGETREELRGDAADVLVPVLETAGAFAELVDALELRLRAQTEAQERARTLKTIAVACDTRLEDPKRAENAYLRALVEDPADAEIHAAIVRLAERLGRETWLRYADALQERAGAIFDAAVTTDLYSRLGHVAEEKLADLPRAARAYTQAAEQGGDTKEVLAALDRIYDKLEDRRALADVLERRMAVELEGPVQADLLHRLGVLQVRSLGETGQGLGSLRAALERAPEHTGARRELEALLDEGALFDDAFDALEWLYRTLQTPEDLALLYERRVGRATFARERVKAKLDLLRVLEDDVKDLARAQRVAESAVVDDPTDETVLAELERLARAQNGWAEAVDALHRAIEGARELSAASRAELLVRLATIQRDERKDAAGAEATFTRALSADPDNLDTLRAIEQLQRVPGRERDLVGTLRRRARLEGDPRDKQQLLREAADLAERTVQDVELAVACLKQLLEDNDADLWALEELTRLRENAGDWEEVATLLLRRAEHVADGGEALTLKHQAARVLEEKIKDDGRAIELYRDILEQEPTDVDAARALRALYERTGRDRDLSKLLSHLIDVATSPVDRSSLRLDLAALQRTKFSAPRDATDTLRALLDDDPGNADAVVALSQLLEATGQDEELAELLHTQIELAKGRGDAAAELALMVRLGEVFEGRLKDTPRALATYEDVLAREPGHEGAQRAVARLAESRGAWDRAAAALEQLLERAHGPEDVTVALRLAQAREHLGDAAGVEAALRRGLTLDASHVEIRTRLRELYEKNQQWQELADLLVGDADLLDLPAGPPPSIPPGASIPPPAGSTADAIRLLRRAADIHLTKRSAPTDAIPILERAALLAPFDRELLLALGDAYTAAGRERDAMTVLERVIASFGTKRTKEMAIYHHRLGKAFAAMGDKQTALTQLDTAFKIDPGSVVVLRDLGILAFEADDLDRAQKTFRALLLQRLDPTSGISKGEVFYYLGEISAKQGDTPRAVQMFERALENEPSHQGARSRLASLKS